MKRVVAGGLSAAFLMPLATAANAHPATIPSRPGTCARSFTVGMATRAARAVYAGTGTVTMRQRRMLGRIVHCQRNPQARGYVRHYYRVQRARWLARRYALAHPWHGPVTASWFYDAGATACGFHTTYGFASLSLPCGAKVSMRGPSGRVVVATREDSGPFIPGREFDLNPALRDALGCGGLCGVYWR